MDTDAEQLEPVEGKTEDELEELPVLTVRDTVVFPGAMLPITVGRPASVALVNSLGENRTIAVVSQLDPRVDAPTPEDLYQVGAICVMHKAIRVPKDNLLLFCEGIERIRTREFTAREPFLKARVERIAEQEPEDTPELQALRQNVAKPKANHGRRKRFVAFDEAQMQIVQLSAIIGPIRNVRPPVALRARLPCRGAKLDENRFSRRDGYRLRRQLGILPRRAIPRGKRRRQIDRALRGRGVGDPDLSAQSAVGNAGLNLRIADENGGVDPQMRAAKYAAGDALAPFRPMRRDRAAVPIGSHRKPQKIFPARLHLRGQVEDLRREGGNFRADFLQRCLIAAHVAIRLMVHGAQLEAHHAAARRFGDADPPLIDARLEIDALFQPSSAGDLDFSPRAPLRLKVPLAAQIDYG